MVGFSRGLHHHSPREANQTSCWSRDGGRPSSHGPPGAPQSGKGAALVSAPQLFLQSPLDFHLRHSHCLRGKQSPCHRHRHRHLP